MNAIHILGSAVLLLLAGCTALPSTGDKKEKDHLLHHPSATLSPAATKSDQQMAQMREVHRKMMTAKTPLERQVLMAEHMKAMQGGMSGAT